MVLLKLHCRPNDLDCWVEALGGSAGWLSVSLPPLYAGGESVLLDSITKVGQALKCNPPWCTKDARDSQKEPHSLSYNIQNQIKGLIGLNYAAKHNNKINFPPEFKQLRLPEAVLLLLNNPHVV